MFFCEENMVAWAEIRIYHGYKFGEYGKFKNILKKKHVAW
jgi:hypothetical protein